MLKGLKGAIFSKTGVSILIGFFAAVLANLQGMLGESGDQIVWGSAILGAVGIAARTTMQKIIELLNKE